MLRFIPIILLLAATGCRETEPPPTHFEDLGTDGSLLLPTFPVWKTAAIADGQADWRPFREPADDADLTDNGGSPQGGSTATGGGVSEAVRSEVETEIRELIAEFNEIVNSGEVDDILDYFVAEQADALKPVVQAALASRDIIQQLKGELDTKLPDATDRSESATKAILVGLSLELKSETLDVKSDTRVDVTVNAGAISQTYRFIIVDEDWYLEVPAAESLAELTSALEQRLQGYRDMLESVRSGAAAAEDRLKELESTVAAAQAPAATETDDGADPNDAPPVDDGTGD